MKLTREIIDKEDLISQIDKEVLHSALSAIEKLNDQLEYEKTIYIDFNEYSYSYIIKNVRTDCPISFLTYDIERLAEDVNILKNYIEI